jgi:hypothetical protein
MTRLRYALTTPTWTGVYHATSEQDALTVAHVLADMMTDCPHLTDGVVTDDDGAEYAVDSDGIRDLRTGAVERRAA